MTAFPSVVEPYDHGQQNEPHHWASPDTGEREQEQRDARWLVSEFSRRSEGEKRRLLVLRICCSPTGSFFIVRTSECAEPILTRIRYAMPRRGRTERFSLSLHAFLRPAKLKLFSSEPAPPPQSLLRILLRTPVEKVTTSLCPLFFKSSASHNTHA